MSESERNDSILKETMKKISICICCYNEEGNVYEMYKAVSKEMIKLKESYDYEIIFADNASEDSTRAILRRIAQEDTHVKVILHTRNFGTVRSFWNCFFRAQGDAVLALPCDFQVLPESIPDWIRYWEEGNLLVCGQKVKSKENPLKFFLRKLYYDTIQVMSDITQYYGLVGLTLVDRSLISQMRQACEPDVDFRHLVAELGYSIKLVPYEQQKRREGKSSYNLSRYFDFAVTSLVNTSWMPLRIATVAGTAAAGICFLLGMVYLVYKLLHWYSFDAGMAPLLIGMFFIGSVQLLFIGIVGEYVGAVLRRVKKSPFVVEEEALNFAEKEKPERNGL